MKTIELVGQVDEQHRLSAQMPPDVPPGRFKLSIALVALNPDEDDTGTAWASGVAREWQSELADPREDIYSLTDGEPIDEAR